MRHSTHFLAFSLTCSIIACAAAPSALAQIKSTTTQRSEVAPTPYKPYIAVTPRDTVAPKPVVTGPRDTVKPRSVTTVSPTSEKTIYAPAPQRVYGKDSGPVKQVVKNTVLPEKGKREEKPALVARPIKRDEATTSPITPDQIREQERGKDRPLFVKPVDRDEATTSPITPDQIREKERGKEQPLFVKPVGRDEATTSPITPDQIREKERGKEQPFVARPVGRDEATTSPVDSNGRAPRVSTDRPSRAPGSARDRMGQ